MIYTIEPSYSNDCAAYVLGSRRGSGNIGDRVAQRLARAGFLVRGDDGAVSNHPEGKATRSPGQNITPETAERYGYAPTGEGGYVMYSAPSVQAFRNTMPNVLVITLGRTNKTAFHELGPFTVDQMIKANLILPLEAAQRFVRATASETAVNRRSATDESPIRHIIFVGSYAHEHPFTNGTLYCAAKAAINMAARTMAWELTDKGYRVHVVNPYHVEDTPMWETVQQDVMRTKGMTREEADAYGRKDLKMPRPLAAEDVARVIESLVVRPGLDWMVGQPINLYGGTR